jgi:hypothetical protein
MFDGLQLPHPFVTFQVMVDGLRHPLLRSSGRSEEDSGQAKDGEEALPDLYGANGIDIIVDVLPFKYTSQRSTVWQLATLRFACINACMNIRLPACRHCEVQFMVVGDVAV